MQIMAEHKITKKKKETTAIVSKQTPSYYAERSLPFLYG